MQLTASSLQVDKQTKQLSCEVQSVVMIRLISTKVCCPVGYGVIVTVMSLCCDAYLPMGSSALNTLYLGFSRRATSHLYSTCA
jgi:hypothetical protein